MGVSAMPALLCLRKKRRNRLGELEKGDFSRAGRRPDHVLLLPACFLRQGRRGLSSQPEAPDSTFPQSSFGLLVEEAALSLFGGAGRGGGRGAHREAGTPRQRDSLGGSPSVLLTRGLGSGSAAVTHRVSAARPSMVPLRAAAGR